MIKKETYSFWYYWFPVILYCSIIFLQSSYPAVKEIPELPYVDKLIHFAGYALLGLLFVRGFRNSRFKDGQKCIVAVSILLTGLYGAADELHQHYVAARTAEVLDVLFDLSGGIFGVIVYQILVIKYPALSRI